jgi:hypothetical protein
MESLADILESDLTEAVEVKNPRSLHRYIILLTENLVQQRSNDREHSEFREAIIRIDTRIEEGFKRMDERFISSDKRFDDMNRRFTMLFSFMTTGFVALATLITVFQLVG